MTYSSVESVAAVIEETQQPQKKWPPGLKNHRSIENIAAISEENSAP